MKTTTIATTLLTITASLAAAACGNSTTQETADAVSTPSPSTTFIPATTTIGPATSTISPTTTVSLATTTVSPATTTVERPTEVVDELVRIDHGRLHLRCVGAGPTTVLLVAGWGDGGDKWGAIEPTVAERARVCSYSRFGTGTSDPPSTTQTFATQAADLHALLDTARRAGPLRRARTVLRWPASSHVRVDLRERGDRPHPPRCDPDHLARHGVLRRRLRGGLCGHAQPRPRPRTGRRVPRVRTGRHHHLTR